MYEIGLLNNLQYKLKYIQLNNQNEIDYSICKNMKKIKNMPYNPYYLVQK